MQAPPEATPDLRPTHLAARQWSPGNGTDKENMREGTYQTPAEAAFTPA